MSKFKSALVALWREEEGLTMVEYAIAGALVAGGAVAAFTALGTAIAARINQLVGWVTG